MRRSVMAVFAGLAVLAAGCAESDPGIEADRSIARAAATPIGDTGLPTGTPRELWRRDVPGPPPERPVHAELVAGQVVVVSDRGVDALDAHTGAPRWHYREKNRAVTDYTITPDAVVLSTIGAGPDGEIRTDPDQPPHTIGLDGATGRTLWSSDDPLYVRMGLPERRNPSFATGVLLLTTPEGNGLTRVDSSTGKKRWTWEDESGDRCKFDLQDTDGSLLPVLVDCVDREQDTLYVLDPATGAVRWKRAGEKMGAITRGGVTLLAATSGPVKESELLAADGGTIWTLRDRELMAADLAVLRGRAVLTLRGGGSNGRWFEFVDIATGRVGRRIPARVYGGLVPTGGRVYGIRQWTGEYAPHEEGRSPGLVPGGLEVIDPVKGEAVPVPLPFRVTGNDHAENPRFVVIKGDRLVHVQRLDTGLRLTGYGPGDPRAPAETGGVAPGDWPDACRLTARMSRLRYRTPAPKEVLRLGEVKIAHWGCVVQGRELREFHIGWVARTPEEARALLGDMDGWKAVAVGDEAYVREQPRGPLIMRTGRYIVVFDSDDVAPGGFNRSLVEAVDEALR